MSQLPKIRLKTLTINQKLALFFFVLFLYDVWFNILAYLFLIIFEFIEYFLEILTQYVLGVRHHTSEIIVLNLLTLFTVMAGVYLWFSLPRLIHYFNCLIIQFLKQFSMFWLSLALLEKIKLSVIYLLISSSFIIFLSL
jgi:hypothetical protein